ncbi:unnamed protein product [Linum tenue]|uniref:Uncharacterized protein n=1 Tax=Linum tenue TaxID=586396 RepID=A0AAV0KQ30_9ROSI|nr:unnamed protein product [Linum tenue]
MPDSSRRTSTPKENVQWISLQKHLVFTFAIAEFKGTVAADSNGISTWTPPISSAASRALPLPSSSSGRPIFFLLKPCAAGPLIFFLRQARIAGRPIFFLRQPRAAKPTFEVLFLSLASPASPSRKREDTFQQHPRSFPLLDSSSSREAPAAPLSAVDPFQLNFMQLPAAQQILCW